MFEKKTVGIMMKGRLAKSRCPNVKVSGKMLVLVSEVRYLGVKISEQMNFGVHVKRLREKVTNIVNGIKRVMRKEWDLRRITVRVIYKGLLTACVMYGAVTWYKLMKYAYARRAIEQCERVGLYACMNVCRTVSTSAMEVLMRELPWMYEVKKRVSMFEIRKNLKVTSVDEVTAEMVSGKTMAKCKGMIKGMLVNKWQHD